MKVLVIGGGGREHALCWAVSRSAEVFCAPGNPGTAALGMNLAARPDDHGQVLAAVREHDIDLVVVGPEAPLAAGLVDALAASGRHAFGPTAAAARIESSKAFAKDVMEEAGVPTGRSGTFTDRDEALAYVAGHDEPLVVKASGLAAGKGVIICATRDEAAAAVRSMFEGAFGSAGQQVLVEEHLTGEELSMLALTDGEQLMLLPASQDHKRIGEGDTGPNTGGMGAYTPVSIVGDHLLERVEREVLRPVLRTLAARGAPYRGVLYAGIMIDEAGTPRVLEFNCRFGDPEAQVVLPALTFDITEHLWRIASGETWHPEPMAARGRGAAVTTVLASPGYPGTPATGGAIAVPAELPDQTILFHAGTRADDDGTLRTAGGRVLCATGLGATVPEAAVRSRALAEAVRFEGRQYRRDIAWREVARAGAA